MPDLTPARARGTEPLYTGSIVSSTWSTLAKVAAFFAVVLLLSLGLCGLALAQSKSTGADLATLSLWGMVIGAAGLLLSGVAAVVLAIVSAFQGGPPPPPR